MRPGIVAEPYYHNGYGKWHQPVFKVSIIPKEHCPMHKCLYKAPF